MVEQKQKKCLSCNKAVMNDGSAATFSCPSCGKADIIRCTRCRKTGVKYICAECKHQGP